MGLPQLPISMTELPTPIPNLQTDSVMTAEELKQNFLYGVPLTSPITGQTLSDAALRFHIDAATSWLEKYLQIDIKPKYYAQERHDYVRSEYANWSFIRLWHTPILKIYAYQVIYPDTGSQVPLPLEWVQTDAEGISGAIQLVPGVGSANSFIIGMGNSLIPNLIAATDYLPDLFKISYAAGFEANKVPAMITSIIGKKAAVDIMMQVGNSLLGLGMVQATISIDGMSQSVSKNPFIFEKQIQMLRSQIEQEVSEARSYYNGLRMVVA